LILDFMKEKILKYLLVTCYSIILSCILMMILSSTRENPVTPVAFFFGIIVVLIQMELPFTLFFALTDYLISLLADKLQLKLNLFKKVGVSFLMMSLVLVFFIIFDDSEKNSFEPFSKSILEYRIFIFFALSSRIIYFFIYENHEN
jgi:hypothetical protein